MNDAPVNPHDVIVRQQRSGGFVLATGRTPAQISCDTFEEALANAERFADEHAASLWYADEAQQPVRLERHLLTRVWAEYCELPGLGLTAPQAQRLWGVSADTCETLLDVLVRAGMLVRGVDGRYRRFTAESVGSGARMAKAAVRQPTPLVAAGVGRRLV